MNGRFHILEIVDTGARSLDEENLTVEAKRYAEIYGSPAIAHGRIFFTTEGGIYAIGDPSTALQPDIRQPQAGSPPQGGGDAAMIVAVPAEVRMRPGEKRLFQVQAFDKLGRPLGERQAEWGLVGLSGLVNHRGEFEADSHSKVQVGVLQAKLGSLTAEARVRVFDGPELEEDFQSTPVDQIPDYFLGARIHFKVQEEESGNRFLVKNPAARSIHRHRTFVGPSDWSDYTIEADLPGHENPASGPRHWPHQQWLYSGRHGNASADSAKVLDCRAQNGGSGTLSMGGPPLVSHQAESGHKRGEGGDPGGRSGPERVRSRATGRSWPRILIRFDTGARRFTHTRRHPFISTTSR